MSIREYQHLSPWDWADLFARAMEGNHPEVEIPPQKMGVLRTWFDSARWCKAMFADGAWHTENEINTALGTWACETMELLLYRGHDFEKCGKDWRMVRFDLSKGPRRRGRIIQYWLPMPGTSSASIPDALFKWVVALHKYLVEQSSSKPEG
jgi:hypothetical protein